MGSCPVASEELFQRRDIVWTLEPHAHRNGQALVEGGGPGVDEHRHVGVAVDCLNCVERVLKGDSCLFNRITCDIHPGDDSTLERRITRDLTSKIMTERCAKKLDGRLQHNSQAGPSGRRFLARSLNQRDRIAREFNAMKRSV